MFLDDEKDFRDRRKREGRTVLYITLTALAACVLMFVGLMNVANARELVDERTVISGMIGDTRLSLDLGPRHAADHAGASGLSVPVLSDGLDAMTTAATAADEDDATSIDRRLATALGLGALIVVAGVGQLAGRATETLPSEPQRRSSEA